MRMNRRRMALLLVAPLAAGVLVLVGCASVRRLESRAALQDGNKAYEQEDFGAAVEHYERALRLNPSLIEAHFYLGSAYQALYKPGVAGQENRARLDRAVLHYRAALASEGTRARGETSLHVNALGALLAIYSEPPYRDFDAALGFARGLTKTAPDSPSSLIAMGGFYKRFDRIAEAEQSYGEAYHRHPQHAGACNELAAFFGEKHWNGAPRFDQSIQVRKECAALAPHDPKPLVTIAGLYWYQLHYGDLSKGQRSAYAGEGLAFVERALGLAPAYCDALVYKGLLYRERAADARAADRILDLDRALACQKEALTCKKASGEPSRSS
jgi:tetratricopeptide (TPR) repeat protein